MGLNQIKFQYIEDDMTRQLMEIDGDQFAEEEYSLEVSIENGFDTRDNNWWNDLYFKCQNKMTMREFLTVFNGGYGMVLAVSPYNFDKLAIEDVKIIGKVL